MDSSISIHIHRRGQLPPGLAEPIALLRQASHKELHPADPEPRLARLKAEVLAPERVGREQHWVLAEWNGRPAGYHEVQSDSENPQLVWMEPFVLPELRRKGIGRALMQAALEALAHKPLREAGFFLSEGHSAAKPLMAAVEVDWGWSMKLQERVSRMDLAPWRQADLRDQISQRLTKVGDHYRSIFFEMDDLPDLSTGFDLDDFCDMVEEIENLMPLEGLEMEPEVYDAKRFRSLIDGIRKSKRMFWTVVMQERESGRCAGITNVTFDPEDPRQINQWDTGVRKDHQGRGIGKAVKLIMLQHILDELPEATFVQTENADSNAAMLAINEAMGFKPYFRWRGYQGPLSEFKSRLKLT